MIGKKIYFLIEQTVLLLLLLSGGCQVQKNTAGLMDNRDSVKVIEARASVRPVTQGPKQHWFGYYDKYQINASGRYALGGEVEFFFRPPTPGDTLKICLIDLQNGNRWKQVGTSTAWGWQQGCMLQWVPGSDDEIVWNDREGDHFVARLYNIKSGKMRTLPKAIYTVSPDGKWALGTEFVRIQNMRPGYGYPGFADPDENIKAPKDKGLYKMDLATGNVTLLFSYADLANLPHAKGDLSRYWNYFNHLLVSPDGNRFIFLHRWREEMGPREKRATGGFFTRMVTASKEGKDLFVVDPSGNTSHFIWKDSEHITAWTKPDGYPAGFYEFEDKKNTLLSTGKGAMTENGHNTFVPGTNNEWILNDTYPSAKDRKQTLYLYHTPSNTKIILGRFTSPPEYKGEWRCDLHPRTNRQGTKVYFDSPHEGNGRQMYEIDIRRIIRKKSFISR
ncbi:MAG: hypothetical protein WKF97_13280 [Chitinophagaceae bacterium]